MMVQTIRNGRPGTGMMAFDQRLAIGDIQSIVRYVRCNFMRTDAGGSHTRYHTAQNGWPNHERYRPAFAFVRGQIPVDTPWQNLSKVQQSGLQLFMSACITCHDHGRSGNGETIWESRPLSYPRAGYSHRQPRSDSVSGASPYVVHDAAPAVDGLTESERLGEQLYQSNCAFCHAADGSGRNWVGSFLEPHPRDLTNPEMRSRTRDQLIQTVRKGLRGTTMSAWESVLDDDEISVVVDYVIKVFIKRGDQQAIPR